MCRYRPPASYFTVLLPLISCALLSGCASTVPAKRQDPVTQSPAQQETLAAYVDAIRKKIRSNIVLPDGTPKRTKAVFSVVQLPSGEILKVTLVTSSGYLPYDAAVQRAILLSSPLPQVPTAQLFHRDLHLTFVPDCIDDQDVNYCVPQ